MPTTFRRGIPSGLASNWARRNKKVENVVRDFLERSMRQRIRRKGHDLFDIWRQSWGARKGRSVRSVLTARVQTWNQSMLKGQRGHFSIAQRARSMPRDHFDRRAEDTLRNALSMMFLSSRASESQKVRKRALLSASEVSKLFEVPESRAREQARLGTPPSIRLGHYVRFNAEEIQREANGRSKLRKRR